MRTAVTPDAVVGWCKLRPVLKAPGFSALKLKYDKLFASVAFTTNLRPYAVAEALNLHGWYRPHDAPHSCTPHVAGRNSVGDTFAVFTDPQLVLAAVPDLQKIAALGRAIY